MKLRTGFVSNSSSVSFTIVLSYKDYLEALDKMPRMIREAINRCGEPGRKIISGADLVQVVAETEDIRSLFGQPFQTEEYEGNRDLKRFLNTLQEYPYIVNKVNK